MLFCLQNHFYFEIFFQKYHLGVKKIGPRSGPTFGRLVGPDPCSICSQMLSADDTRRQRVTVVPTKSDSDVMLCLQLLSKTLPCTLHFS